MPDGEKGRNEPDDHQSTGERPERSNAHRMYPLQWYEGHTHTEDYQCESSSRRHREQEDIEGDDIPNRGKTDKAVVFGFVAKI